MSTDPDDTTKAQDRTPPSDEERAVVRLWREALAAQDARYESKGLLKVIAVCMRDPEYRRSILTNAGEALAPLRAYDVLPEGVELRFHENTPQVLHVVLPPLCEELMQRDPALRERLRSRTSERSSFLLDDFDLGDWWDHSVPVNLGNPHSRDQPGAIAPH